MAHSHVDMLGCVTTPGRLHHHAFTGTGAINLACLICLPNSVAPCLSERARHVQRGGKDGKPREGACVSRSAGGESKSWLCLHVQVPVPCIRAEPQHSLCNASPRTLHDELSAKHTHTDTQTHSHHTHILTHTHTHNTHTTHFTHAYTRAHTYSSALLPNTHGGRR